MLSQRNFVKAIFGHYLYVKIVLFLLINSSETLFFFFLTFLSQLRKGPVILKHLCDTDRLWVGGKRHRLLWRQFAWKNMKGFIYRITKHSLKTSPMAKKIIRHGFAVHMFCAVLCYSSAHTVLDVRGWLCWLETTS